MRDYAKRNIAPAEEKKGSATESQRQREKEEKERREEAERRRRKIELIHANQPTNEFVRNRHKLLESQAVPTEDPKKK